MFAAPAKRPDDPSLALQLYPPDRGRFGEVLKTAGLLARVLPTANAVDLDAAQGALEAPAVQACVLANRHAAGAAAEKIAMATATSPVATAEALARLIPPSVTQLARTDRGYTLKTANHALWSPSEFELSRREAIEKLGAARVREADLHGAITEAGEVAVPSAAPPPRSPGVLRDAGVYEVRDLGGERHVGYVFPSLLDIDGRATPLALFVSGSETALQGEIAGVPAGGTALALPEGRPRGRGVFVRLAPGEDPCAMVPMDLRATIADGGVALLAGETFDGRPVRIERSRHLALVLREGDVTLVPDTFRWVPLDEARALTLDSGETPRAPKEAASTREVLVRADASGTFSFEGGPVAKLAYAERSFLSVDDAMFLLAGLGVPLEHGTKKLGAAMARSQPLMIAVARELEPAASAVDAACARAAAKLAMLPPVRPRAPLVKEAAVLPDPMAVDTVLSLGFLNAENIALFLEGLPTIEAAQERMCELLLAARLGLRDVPPAALEKAVRATEQVLEGLHVLAFERPGEAA
jgi:hypothetical protein